MKKFIARILTLFIPSKKLRHKIRAKISPPDKVRSDLARLQTAFSGLFIYIENKDRYPKVMSIDETLDFINKNPGISVSRFGDGEFMIAFEICDSPFQKLDKKLSLRLREILAAPVSKKCSVMITPTHQLKPNEPVKNYIHWGVFYKDCLEKILSTVDSKRIYQNACISRDIDLSNIKKYRKIWDGKDVCFVTSSKGRFIKDERLFDNIKNSFDIDIPPANAFAEYDRILSDCLEFGKKHKDAVFFISAGMTATVLAWDLAQAGFTALDMGHLPNCLANNLGEQPLPENTKVIQK